MEEDKHNEKLKNQMLREAWRLIVNKAAAGVSRRRRKACLRGEEMAVSDAVVGNLTTIYLVMIAGIKAVGMVAGRSFGGGFVLILSTAMVVFILIGTLTWEISRKAKSVVSRDLAGDDNEMCKGGICWHGVAARSAASQVKFRLPQSLPYAT